MVETTEETLNLPQEATRARIISRGEAPDWLASLLNVDVGDQEEIDIGIGSLRGKQLTDNEGRFWECDDISFRNPFPDHFHSPNLEIILVKGGRAKIKFGGDIEKEGNVFEIRSFEQQVELIPGSIVIIPPNVPQGIEILEAPLETRVLMTPPYDPKNEHQIQVTS